MLTAPCFSWLARVQSSKIGLTVNQLRKAATGKLADLANDVIKDWKRLAQASSTPAAPTSMQKATV